MSTCNSLLFRFLLDRVFRLGEENKYLILDRPKVYSILIFLFYLDLGLRRLTELLKLQILHVLLKIG
jgi:hypothetical protein